MGICALVVIVLIIIAGASSYGSIWSPLGMVGVVISVSLMINPMFQYGGNVLGWFLVIIAFFFYILTIKAIMLYFKSNKL